MVALKEDELNQFFEILKDWEVILQAEKSLLNNEMTDSQSSTSSEQEVS